MEKRHILCTLTAILCTWAVSSTAGVLMIDFGPVPVDTLSATNSPYHTANTAFTDTTWNQITENDEFTAGGLLYSDGTPATGITVDIGDTPSAPVMDLNLSSPVLSKALGTEANSGVYAGNSVAKDGIFADTRGTRRTGFQVGGLPAGTYDIYLTGRNTNTSGLPVTRFSVGTSGAPGNFKFSQYPTQDISYGESSIESWVPYGQAGANYAKFRVTIKPNECLNVVTVGTTMKEWRGFINSAQIVPVP